MDDLRPAGPAEYRWLLAVQERERRLLAQAVHDDIGQYLTGIRTQLPLFCCAARQATGSRRWHAWSATARGWTTASARCARSTAAGPCNASRWTRRCGCVADWQEGQASPASCACGPLPPPDAAAGTHLYRLLQEALNNVARHAGASRVRIRLQRRGGFYRSVRDDGQAAADPAPGFGLTRCATRAAWALNRACAAVPDRPGVAFAGCRWNAATERRGR